MPQMQVLHVSNRNLSVVQSFVAGNRIVNIHLPVTQEDVLARALWLESHGRPAEAEECLDNFLRRKKHD